MDAIAETAGWQKLRLPTRDFVLTAYVPEHRAADHVLTLYIEGDGFAWASRSRPSEDPTPHLPLGLELALRHPRGAAAYLARPCQNVAATDWRSCNEAYWTNRRYAPELVDAANQSASALKALFTAEQLVLVGYSGGGAIAALLAARRTDVVRLVTVAGNLDTETWTSFHGIEPLTGSLNPADGWEKLMRIPQLHFVGGKDKVITSKVVDAYVNRFPLGYRPQVRLLPGFDHACCWIDNWNELTREAFP